MAIVKVSGDMSKMDLSVGLGPLPGDAKFVASGSSYEVTYGWRTITGGGSLGQQIYDALHGGSQVSVSAPSRILTYTGALTLPNGGANGIATGGGSGTITDIKEIVVAPSSASFTITGISIDLADARSLLSTPAALLAGADTLSMSPNSQGTILGYGGDDSIMGGIGQDSLNGGDGNNTINGDVGNDTIDGGSGQDSIMGGGDRDFIRALDGDDTVDGGAGFDDVNGNQGVDLVHGGDGNDSARGGQGNDTVYGDAGDDPHVNGNIGDDIVYGGLGNDTIYGGQGQDTLYGDAGIDLISGDLGNDLLYGGAGGDHFFQRAGGGIDWVADFKASEGDRIRLSPGTAYTLVNSDGQVMLDLGDGAQIGLSGVSFSTFSTTWLVFA